MVHLNWPDKCSHYQTAFLCFSFYRTYNNRLIRLWSLWGNFKPLHSNYSLPNIALGTFSLIYTCTSDLAKVFLMFASRLCYITCIIKAALPLSMIKRRSTHFVIGHFLFCSAFSSVALGLSSCSFSS